MMEQTACVEHRNNAASSDLVSIDEVMELTGLSRQRVYANIRRGVIPSFRIGRVVRVRRGPLLRWIEQGGTKRCELESTGRA